MYIYFLPYITSMFNILRLKLLTFSATKYKLSSEGKSTDHSLFTS